MQALYFGPYDRPGHFLFLPGGRMVNEYNTSCPWKQIDGVLQQGCVFKFMRFQNGVENQGEAILHYRDGWTALCFWDRCVDRRGACNSNFFFDQSMSFEAAIQSAQEYFPDRWRRMNFKVYEATIPNNALICTVVNTKHELYEPHRPVMVHRTGVVSADVLNLCGDCGLVIGNWYGQWVTLDSWSENKVRTSGRIVE